MKKFIPPLIIEKIIDDSNLYFLSLIEFKRTEYIGIINDITATHVKAYTFENLNPSAIGIEDFMTAITRWYYSESYYKPLSISLSQHGMTGVCAPLFKNFEINGVSRIVGNPFMYGHFNRTITKKRKVLPIPEGVEIRLKRLNLL